MYHRQQRLAVARLATVLNKTLPGRHTTLVPERQLHDMANQVGLTVTIVSKHEYADYTSIVYKIN
jgi:hypothetical protein